MDNISDYASEVVSGDWSPAVEAWFLDRELTGGTLNIDQDVTFKSTATLIPTPPEGVAPVPLNIVSDGSAHISADGPLTANFFYTGNIERLSLRDLYMGGTGDPTNADCSAVVSSNYTEQVNVERCALVGLRANAVIQIGASASAYVRDCILSGGSYTAAVEGTPGFRTLSVKNTQMVDHDSLRGVYHSKSPAGVGAWIKAVGDGEPAGNSYCSLLDVENCTGDEAAAYQIYAKDVQRVVINKFAGNINSGDGIYLENIRNVHILNTWIGYEGDDQVIIRLANCGDVLIENLQQGQDNRRIVVDANTRLTVRNSPGIKIERV